MQERIFMMKKRAKKGKHVSSRKVGILENVKIAYKGMKEE